MECLLEEPFMSQYIGEVLNLPPLLRAVAHWKNECLLKNRSIFSKKKLWTTKNVNILLELYVNNPDESNKDFFEKLKGQLGVNYPDVICLVAEMMWILLLPSINITERTKIENIAQVWEWSGSPFNKVHNLLSDETLAGYANTSIGYNTNRWRELSYLIEITGKLLSLPLAARNKVLNDGWELAYWLEKTPESRRRQFRHILLYLLFPDDFERITSGVHRLKIVSTFDNVAVKNLRKMELWKIDRRLLAIRKQQEQILGTTKIDFYQDPLHDIWHIKKKSSAIDIAPQIIKKEEARVNIINNDKKINKKIKEQMIYARQGHGIYRRKLAEVEKRCRITGVQDTRFLTASHIKPWRDCDTHNECLDGNNGLWMSPHLDRLFDQGWISFNDDGDLLFTDEIVMNVLSVWKIKLPVNIGTLNKLQQSYMLYHRKYVYKNGDA
ncbi:HNH endonuclease [Salmonella enterica]|uniref:HNH endonuclease n=1 Tax=Salmonella newport TaxID=108619 RepID=A0A5W1YV36_SALNE|nr:HNH endonuclease [Salmonella enterica]EBW3117290.1 HNH endonuclease [Salmonella enterica subsp. enterica serovar Newport]EAQ6093911.1 HNH endonuclease [Salmonella enterica]EAS1788484.1 HNH endonuclease [Salmonella enterica]EAS1972845.1 HNH endonuclease [Salmonella enterica]